MTNKAYCESSNRYLVLAIVITTVATLGGTFFFYGRNTKKASAAVAEFPSQANAAQAAAVDGFTGATLNGGIRLIAPTRAQTPGNSLLPLENIQELLNTVAAGVAPSVVHIEVVRADPLGGSRRTKSIGSGVIVDRRGYVLTNYHVLEEAEQMFLTTYAKAGPVTYDGKLVHSDVGTDLAVVRILGDTEFPPVKLGDSSSLEVGDWVLAMGSPLDLAQTVSFGIISALRETVRIGGITYTDMIQTDAHINRGNSGGPLVNIYGEVIGINTAIYAPNGAFTGVGFAIPPEHAKALLDELNIAPHRFSAAVAMLTKARGKALNKGSWLGVEGLSLTVELAAQYDLPVNQGVYVRNVFVNSPAHKSGLVPGDVLLWVDDNPVNDVDQLKLVLSRTLPGKNIMLNVYRADRMLELTVETTAKW